MRYFPKAWVVPTPDCYETQSASGLVLKQEFHHYLLNTYLCQGLDVVHIHTHAGNQVPDFSDVDDRYEAEYVRFLNSHFRIVAEQLGRLGVKKWVLIDPDR